jgi:hypothetical protein
VVLVGAGTCTITASQAGGTDYNPATSVTESFTINPMATRSTLALTPASQAPGGMVVLKATVKAMPHYHPTGQVSFYVNGALVGSSSLGSGGVARYTYTVSLPHQAAKYPVYAVFASSDSNFAGSTSVTKKLKVTA